jgi:hypothetical protein
VVVTGVSRRCIIEQNADTRNSYPPIDTITDINHMPVRDCFPKTFQLATSLQVIDHIGSGGNAAVVRGFVGGETVRELALKLLDPKCVNADHRERENRKAEQALGA